MALPNSRDYDAVDAGPLPHTVVNNLQDGIVGHEARLDTAEATIATHETRLDALEPTSTDHESRIDALEAADAALDARVDTLEAGARTVYIPALDAIATGQAVDYRYKICDTGDALSGGWYVQDEDVNVPYLEFAIPVEAGDQIDEVVVHGFVGANATSQFSAKIFERILFSNPPTQKSTTKTTASNVNSWESVSWDSGDADFPIVVTGTRAYIVQVRPVATSGTSEVLISGIAVVLSKA